MPPFPKDNSVVHRRRHEDGSMVLSKAQAADKFEAVSKVQSAGKNRAEGKLASLSAADLMRPLVVGQAWPSVGDFLVMLLS